MNPKKRLIPALAVFCFLMALAVTPASADLTSDLCGKLVNLANTTEPVQHPKIDGTTIPTVIDTVEGRSTPVPHCYMHAVLRGDSPSRVLLPQNWNGKFVLGMGGAAAGSETAVTEYAYLLAEGYAYAEGAQGHMSPVYTPEDTWEELNWLANHQLTGFAKDKVQKLYGKNPRRTYLFGYSAGGQRALALLDRYSHEYDGAGVGSPAIDNRYIVTYQLSLIDYYYPLISAKIPDIARARDLGYGDQDVFNFAGLTSQQIDALKYLYDGGLTRGTEFALSTPTQGPSCTPLNMTDPNYLYGDFWLHPGYEGYEGLVNSQIVEGLTGTVMGLGTPNTYGYILSLNYSSTNTYAAGSLVYYRIVFTTGALKGQQFFVSGNTTSSITITGRQGALNGAAIGDKFTMDNRGFLAWEYYHRHIVVCGRPEFQDFCREWNRHDHHIVPCDRDECRDRCQDEVPIYVQRSWYVQEAVNENLLSGTLHGRAVIVAGTHDDSVWHMGVKNFFDRVHETYGHHVDSAARMYWLEKTTHTPPSSTRIDRAVSMYPAFYLAFHLMDKWVDQGIAPPTSTVVTSITPGTIVYPPTADQRKGLQPTVSSLTGNGVSGTVTVSVNKPVTFNGLAWSPIGKIAQYEWDFDSNNSYDCAVTSLSSTCGVGNLTQASQVNLQAVHTYTAQGTYVATVRVTDDTVNPPGFASGIQNLGKVVVIVGP